MTTQSTVFETYEFPWWLVLMEGIAALILGLFLFTAPGATVFVLMQLLGIYWLLRGIFQITSIFIDNKLWGWKLFAGILGIFAGILIMRHPFWSGLILPATIAIIIGLQGIVVGVINLFVAFKGGGWGVGILALLSIVLGLILVFNPFISGVALVILIASFAVIGGFVSIISAFRLRSAQIS